MAQTKIPQGTKLTLFYDGDDSETAGMKSTFEKDISEVSFLVSAPMKGTGYLEMDPFKQIFVKYKLGNTSMIIIVYAEEPVAVGRRVFWRLRRVSAPREFIPRVAKRYSMNIRVECTSLLWDPQNPSAGEKIPAVTLDVSAGGVALCFNSECRVGEILNIIFPASGTIKALSQKAEICWIREAPKGNPYRTLIGLKFVFTDEDEKTALIKYINMAIVKYA